MPRRHTALTILLAIVATQCGVEGPTSPTGGSLESPIRSRTAVLLAAADIGQCDVPTVAAVGQLVRRLPGHLVLAGDIAYPHGRREDFVECFDRHWGHARDRWHATPGNHEYESDEALPYFEYFGGAAGPAGRGYYEFVLRDWLILMLNSEIGTEAGSPQYAFVQDALERHPTRCQIAVWHRPLFSSGPHGPRSIMRDIWRLLDRFDAEIVLSGHDHLYERFAPQDADGRPDAGGIRQFTVGTGGAILYDFVRVSANSEVRMSMHGVLRLTLRPDSYSWELLGVAGGIFDLGAGVCR